MSIKARLRILHRKISPWVLPLLLFIAGTGLYFRIALCLTGWYMLLRKRRQPEPPLRTAVAPDQIKR